MKVLVILIQVTSIEKTEEESSKKILQLLDVKRELNDRIRVLEAKVDEADRAEHMQEEDSALAMSGLKTTNAQLEDKVAELQVSIRPQLAVHN